MKNNYPKDYQSIRYCAFCGFKNSTHHKYCVNCGFELTKDTLDTIDYRTRSQNNPLETKTVEKEIVRIPPSNSYRSVIVLIIFLGIGILFIATNPNEKKHLDYIQKEWYANQLKSSSELEALFLNLGRLIFSEDNINSVIKSQVTRTNYYIFSVTRGNDTGEIITIGFLGNIIFLDDLIEKLDSIFS
jgi:hypothetical protein